MRITLMQTGKTRDSFVREGVEQFRKRVEKYVPFQIETIPDLKNTRNMTMKEVQKKEGEQQLRRLKQGSFLMLLDERGEIHDSIAFARQLQSLESQTVHLVFLIGGPYGFSEELYKRAQARLSLSRLTFSHQLVRVIFMEQLYRAFTILRGEPYHHA